LVLELLELPLSDCPVVYADVSTVGESPRDWVDDPNGSSGSWGGVVIAVAPFVGDMLVPKFVAE
jgi:hypothetical protein